MKTFALLSLSLCLLGGNAWAADESATPPPAPGRVLCQQDPQKCTEMRNARHAWCVQHPGQCGRRSGTGPRNRNTQSGMGPGMGQGMQGQGMQGQGGMGQGMRMGGPGNCGGRGQMPCQAAPAQPATPAEAPK